MNPTETQTPPIKRGPGRPRKLDSETTPPEPETTAEIIEAGAKAIMARVLALESVQVNQTSPAATIPATNEVLEEAMSPLIAEPPKMTLGQIYAAIDASQPEWLPSVVAKAVEKAMREAGLAEDEINSLVKSVAARIAKNPK